MPARTFSRRASPAFRCSSENGKPHEARGLDALRSRCYTKGVGRPKSEPDKNERAALRQLTDKFLGNISRMAAALGGCDPHALRRKLRMYKLDEVASKLREKNAVSGPRAVKAAPDREKLLKLVVRLGYRSAAAELGISPRTMMRRMHEAGIDGDAIEAARTSAEASP